VGVTNSLKRAAQVEAIAGASENNDVHHRILLLHFTAGLFLNQVTKYLDDLNDASFEWDDAGKG